MKTNFFKSEAFKCIAVLLSIMVIAGGLLAIASQLFFVSDEERLKRAVKKVYGKDVEVTEQQLDEEFSDNEYGTIESFYTFTDDEKDYGLFKSKGKQGYKNGTVTLWILFNMEGDCFEDIKKVVLGDSDKQTLMSKLTGKFYSAYEVIDIPDIESGLIVVVKDGTAEFELKNVAGGATKSSNAANNAVNAVLYYIRSIEV